MDRPRRRSPLVTTMMNVLPALCAFSFFPFALSNTAAPLAQSAHFSGAGKPHSIGSPSSSTVESRSQKWPQPVIDAELQGIKGYHLSSISRSFDNHFLRDQTVSSTFSRMPPRAHSFHKKFVIRHHPRFGDNSNLSSHHKRHPSTPNNSRRALDTPASLSRSSTSNSPEFPSGSYPMAGDFDDSNSSDMDPDINANLVPRVITTAPLSTPTTMGSPHPTSPSTTSTSAPSQAPRSRPLISSSSTMPPRANPTAVSPTTPSASASASATPQPNSNSTTFGDVFQHLNSYFKPSNSAFPLAIIITIAAAIIVLLVIISVAKCICHRPKFANPKDYPQGFPWAANNSNPLAARKHGRTPSSPFAKTGEGNWDKIDDEKLLQVAYQSNSWQSDRPLLYSAPSPADPTKIHFREEALPSSQLHHNRRSGPTPPPLAVSHYTQATDLMRLSPGPVSASSESLEGFSDNKRAMNHFGPRIAFAAQPSPSSYDPLRAPSPYRHPQPTPSPDHVDPDFLSRQQASTRFPGSDRGNETRAPSRY